MGPRALSRGGCDVGDVAAPRGCKSPRQTSLLASKHSSAQTNVPQQQTWSASSTRQRLSSQRASQTSTSRCSGPDNRHRLEAGRRHGHSASVNCAPSAVASHRPPGALAQVHRGDQSEIRLELSDASSSAGPRMEPLWSPVVANGGNRRQIEESRKPQKQAKTVAVGCDRLPETFHGKEGVDGSSPSEGSPR